MSRKDLEHYLIYLWCKSILTFINLDHLVYQVAVSRGLNGIGLAIVIPAIHQSLVADSTDDSNRGLAFGRLQLTGNLGSIIGGLCAVLFAPTSILGVPGWRIDCFSSYRSPKCHSWYIRWPICK